MKINKIIWGATKKKLYIWGPRKMLSMFFISYMSYLHPYDFYLFFVISDISAWQLDINTTGAM